MLTLKIITLLSSNTAMLKFLITFFVFATVAFTEEEPKPADAPLPAEGAETEAVMDDEAGVG